MPIIKRGCAFSCRCSLFFIVVANLCFISWFQRGLKDPGIYILPGGWNFGRYAQNFQPKNTCSLRPASNRWHIWNERLRLRAEAEEDAQRFHQAGESKGQKAVVSGPPYQLIFRGFSVMFSVLVDVRSLGVVDFLFGSDVKAAESNLFGVPVSFSLAGFIRLSFQPGSHPPGPQEEAAKKQRIFEAPADTSWILVEKRIGFLRKPTGTTWFCELWVIFYPFGLSFLRAFWGWFFFFYSRVLKQLQAYKWWLTS